MINYQLNLIGIDKLASTESYTNVANNVFCEYIAETGSYLERQSVTANVVEYHLATANPLEGGDIQPYDTLTQSEVYGWVTASLGTSSIELIEQSLSASLANQITPQVIVTELPWA